MMGKKKGGLAILLGLKPGEEEENDDGEEMGDEEIKTAKKDAVRELFAAIEKKDEEGFLDAYETLCDLHEHGGMGGDEEEDGQDEGEGAESY